jgi:hypothetical protein
MNRRPHPVFRVRDLGPEFRSDYGPTLSDQLHWCFDPLARDQVPDHLSALVKKIGEKSSIRPTGSEVRGMEETAKPPGSLHDKTMQQPTFLSCPFCLGTGERLILERGAGRRIVLCHQCRGRGSLATVPAPEKL